MLVIYGTINQMLVAGRTTDRFPEGVGASTVVARMQQPLYCIFPQNRATRLLVAQD